MSEKAPDLINTVTAWRRFDFSKKGLVSPYYPQIEAVRSSNNHNKFKSLDCTWQDGFKTAECSTCCKDYVTRELWQDIVHFQKSKIAYQTLRNNHAKTLPDYKTLCEYKSLEQVEDCYIEAFKDYLGYYEQSSIPSEQCSCGLYGAFDDEHYQIRGKNASGDVVAICEFWGKTQVHKDGLRAEYSKVKAVAPASFSFNPLTLGISNFSWLLGRSGVFYYSDKTMMVLVNLWLSMLWFVPIVALGGSIVNHNFWIAGMAFFLVLLFYCFGFLVWMFKKNKLAKMSKKYGWQYCKLSQLKNHDNASLPKQLRP